MEEESAVAELNPSSVACLHLISAFVAMEPTDCLISFARECGEGAITKEVQSFISEHCIRKSMSGKSPPTDLYVKNFLKKVIIEVESSCDDVLNELYEQFSYYMVSTKGHAGFVGNTRVLKRISFLFPSATKCPGPLKLEIPLQCSVNMLEGDTGCAIWPSSLFLSELILSYPEVFSNKACFEVGSGVGLVGISLAHVKASKVILTDGDLSTLANMKLNLELNQLNTETEMPQGSIQDSSLVQCKHLPWESASEDELQGLFFFCKQLQGLKPDIVLGADVIYDPLSLPHLIRVLGILLNPNLQPSNNSCEFQLLRNDGLQDQLDDPNDDIPYLNQRKPSSDCNPNNSDSDGNSNGSGFGNFGGGAGENGESQNSAVREGPVAYLATIIRNMDTFDSFLRLAKQARLSVVDVTEKWKPLNLLPFMKSYDRSSVRLFHIKLLLN